MNVGILCGAPFLSLADIIGRRGVNFLGNAIVIIAAILQGCSTNVGMFMAGRFLLGFGSSIMSSPQYMAEVAPAHLRGRLVGIFGACFQVGSLAMLGGMIGFAGDSDTNNWSWRIPLLLEALFPTIVCATIYFLTPESPRYLILRGKIDKARKVIAKYQTSSGDENSHLVNAVVAQIEESLENDRVVNRQPWNYSVFFTKAARYRFMILVIYSLFQSWNGGGIIGNNLVPALETIGITNSQSQLGINLGTTVVYFVFTACGAFLVDKVKRRTLIFSGLISFIILQTAATITSWQFEYVLFFSIHQSFTNCKLMLISVTGSNAAAILTVLWIFLFQFFSSLLVATMHNLYPVEFLSLALRARGMGMYSFVQGTAGVVQSYGISVGIGLIGYKIWVVYIVYNCIQLVVSYFAFPETFGLSLEEIDAVFETPGVMPVKMSLDIQKAKKEKARLEAEGVAS